MRLDNEQPSDNVEDRRGDSGGMGFPGGGRRINFPMGGGGRGGRMSLSTLILLAILYFALKWLFGIDLLQSQSDQQETDTYITTEQQGTLPQANTPAAPATTVGGVEVTPESATGDAGRDFVARVLGSTDRTWTKIFTSIGKTYTDPTLVMFTGFAQSACGMAQSATGPFYCPADQKIYIDLSFYQELKSKLGAPGDAAQGYVIAHEVGHHVQNLLGIADKVQRARMQASSESEANALSVKMELQADCYAGIWAQASGVFEPGDIDEALNAASQIGDDRLQKRSQGYVVEDSFTHGSSEQRAHWFKTGFTAKDLNQCNAFN